MKAFIISKRLVLILLLFIMFGFTACENAVQSSGDYIYELSSDGTVQITGYTGSSLRLEIPSELDGHTVTSIGDNAFMWCSSFTSAVIPDSVKTIGQSAFAYCDDLTSVSVSDSVASIGDKAFYDCENLCDITIPGSVTSIGDSAFAGYNKLESINVSNENKNYLSIDGVLFDKNAEELIRYPAGKTDKTYIVPDGVTTLSNSAFENCNELTEITLPDSVVSMGHDVFNSCTNLTSAVIPSSIKSIAYESFCDCANLTSVSIPDSVTSIGDRAFKNCTSLTSITIPKSVESVGEDIFLNCSDLKIYGYTDSAFYSFAKENEISFVALDNLSAPELDSVSNTENGVLVKWNKVDGATKYRVYFKSASSDDWKTAGDSSDTEYTVTKLKSGTNYSFTVKVISPDNGKYNLTGISTTYLSVGTISNLSNGTNGINVEWDKVDGADGYYIYRKDSDGSYTKIETITSADTVSYTIPNTKLESGTSYTYAVCPYSGESDGYYIEKNITYLSAGTVSSLKNTSSGIEIKWKKSSSADGYYIYRKTSDGAYSKIKTITSNSTLSCVDTETEYENGTTYTYKVCPYSEDFQGDCVEKSVIRLSQVSFSQIEQSSDQKLNIKWEEKSDVTGYQIQYSTDSDFSSPKTVTADSDSKTISGLAKNKKYYIRIRSYKDASGEKYYSDWTVYGKTVEISE